MRIISLSLLLIALLGSQGNETTSAPGPGRSLVRIRSTKDGSLQPSYIIVPPGYNANGPAVPLLVALHTWSFTLEQRHPEFEAEAARRNWIYLFPDFRGVDDHAEACGSDLAQQDILDAVTWTRAHFNIDQRNIFLWGWSGGGHMALLMASRQGDLWSAVSAWAGITDMTAYYREYEKERSQLTDRQISACMGGLPGASPAVDIQYATRSPITNLALAARIPIDIWNGIDDSDVAPTHAIAAFNKLAAVTNSPPISPEETMQLTRPNGRLDRPQPSDSITDAALMRQIFLRRTAGPSRITIYKGGHETMATPTFEWFEQHIRR